MTEVEIARIERGAQAVLAEIGLRLDEAKRLTAALRAEMVPPQVVEAGERRRVCEACGRALARATTGRRSAPCSATCRCGSDGGPPEKLVTLVAPLISLAFSSDGSGDIDLGVTTLDRAGTPIASSVSPVSSLSGALSGRQRVKASAKVARVKPRR